MSSFLLTLFFLHAGKSTDLNSTTVQRLGAHPLCQDVLKLTEETPEERSDKPIDKHKDKYKELLSELIKAIFDTYIY